MAGGALGDLVVRMGANIAQFEAAMSKAEMLSTRTADKIEKSMAQGQRAIVGLAAGFASFQTIDAFQRAINGAIDTAAALDDMSEKTGASVESLSALANVAKVSGQDIAGLEGGMIKLAKGIAATVDTGKGAARALEVLGVKARDAAGNLRNTGDLTNDISKALAGYADGTSKAAIAQELFGKSGAQMLPFLKDLATTGDLVTKVTAKQAAEAEQYQKTLKRLQIAGEDLSRTLAMAFLPVMQTVADMLLKSKTSVDGMGASVSKLAQDGTLTRWAENAAYAAAFVVDAFRGVVVVVEAVGVALAGTAQIAMAFAEGVAGGALTGNLNAAFAMGAKIAALQGETKTQVSAILSAHKSVRLELEAQFEAQKRINALVARANAGEFADQNDRRGLPGLKVLKFAGDGAGDAAKITEYAKAMEDANKRLAASYAAIESPLAALTASEKKLAEIRSSSVWETFTTKQRINIRETLEAAASNEKFAIAQKKSRDGMAAMVEELAAANAEYQKFADGQERANLSMFEKAEALNREVDNYGKLPSQIEATTLALMRENLAMLENAGASEMLIESKKSAIRAQEAWTAAVTRKENFESALSTINQMGDAVAGVGRAFVNGVGSGIDYCRNLLKSFLADLAAMAAKKFFFNLVGMVSGDSSIASLANTAAGGSSSNGLLSMIGNSATIGKTLGFGGSMATAYQGFMSGVSGGWASGAAGAGGANFVGPVMPGTQVGNAVGSYAQAAAPYLAALAAIATTYAQMKKWGNDSTGKAGVLGGAAIGGAAAYLAYGASAGPIGIAIAIGAMIGGRLFGRGATNKDASGIQGSVSGGMFSGQDWQDLSQRGGLFRSDKRWTETANMSAEASKYFEDMVSNFRNVFKAIGATLGSDAEKLLEGFTASFKITTKDRTDADIQKDISDFFDKLFRDQLGLVLAENGARLQGYVDSFKGSTAELADFALALAGIAAIIPSMGIAGLSFDALDSMAKNGENIVQTFTRVANDFAGINGTFNTEAENLIASMKAIQDAFSGAGFAGPQDQEDWQALADSIDLSTEAGRKLFDVMVATAPAFREIANAAARMGNDLLQQVARMGSGQFARALAQNQFNIAASAWNAYDVAQGNGGATNSQILSNLQNSFYLVEQRASALAAAGDIAGMQAANALLSAFENLSQVLNSTVVDANNNYTTSTNAAAEAAANLAAQLAGARTGVADYLKGSIISDMSPLTKLQKLAEARAQYDANFSLAKIDNVDAIANFAKYRENLLIASQAVNGRTGAYLGDYYSTYDQGASLTAGAVRPYSAMDGDILKKALVDQLIKNDTTNAAATTTLQLLLTMFLSGTQTIPPAERAFMQAALTELQRLNVSSNAQLSTSNI